MSVFERRRRSPKRRGPDPPMAAGLDQLFLDRSRAFGITMVLVTHDLDSVYAIFDRVAVPVNWPHHDDRPHRDN